MAAVTGALTPSLAIAQSTVEERLERLEAQVDSLQNANQDLRRDLGVEGKAGQAVVKPAGREPTMQFGGLLQVQGDFRDQGDSRFGTHDRFYLRRARLTATGRFLEEIDFKLEAELSGSLGETTNLRAQVTDGYANWNRFPYANVRLGQFKAPFGYEQLYSDSRLYTIERSLGTDRLTLGRQIGGAVVGDVLQQRLAYIAGIFNGTGTNITLNDNDNFLGAGRVGAAPYLGTWGSHDVRWSIGACGYSSHDASITFPPDFGFDLIPGGALDNTFAGDRYGWSLDTQLRVGPLDAWAEYIQVRFEPTDDVPFAAFDGEGAYVLLAYSVVPSRLQAVVKWDEFDPLRNVATNTTETWTLGLNYFLKGDDLRLQLNGLAVDNDLVDTQYKILARAQVIF